MITSVSEDQVASYRENGFLIFEEYFTPEELEALLEAVEDAVRKRKRAVLPWDDPEVTGGDQNKAIFLRVNLRVDNPKVRDILDDARLGKLVADLEGIDRVRILGDRAIYKPPYADPTAWHQDARKFSFTSEHTVNMWVALDDVTLLNGCLFYLPGTHRRRLEQDFGSCGRVSAVFEAYPELGHLEPVPVLLKAGGCSFNNGLTLHAAAANMTPHRRRAMSCLFMPDGCTYDKVPDEGYPEDYQLNVGDVLDHEELHPLIYSRGHNNAMNPSAISSRR